TVRLLLGAQRRWREHGIEVDLVILDLSEGGYRQGTHEAIRAVIDDVPAGSIRSSGGVFLLGRSRLDDDQVRLLEAVAAVSLDAGRGLEESLAPPSEAGLLPGFTASAPDLVDSYLGEPLGRPDELLLDNGFGGFSQDGREYVIYSAADPVAAPATPAPWSNVLANEELGCLVTEAGSAT